MNVNLRGTFFCCQEALRIMYPQGSGAIVNTSADAAFNPIYGFALPAAGKGGIVNMTKTLELEAAPRGIRVQAVSPGIRRTDRKCVALGKGVDGWYELGCRRTLQIQNL